MKYICSGAYYSSLSMGSTDVQLYWNDKYNPDTWLHFTEYLPTGKKHTTANGSYIYEKISSPEFSAHLLDTYLSNCNETLKISEKVNRLHK